MTGSVMIGEKRVELSATLGTMLRYKQQFGREYNDDITELNALKDSENEEYYTMLAVTGVKLIWAMAKTADNSIPTFEVWVDIFDGVDISPILKKAISLYSRSLGVGQDTDEAGNDDENNDDENTEFSTESLVAICLACGISVSDLDRLTVDSVVKILSELAELRGGKEDDEDNEDDKKEQGSIRKATPEDIQAFFG